MTDTCMCGHAHPEPDSICDVCECEDFTMRPCNRHEWDTDADGDQWCTRCGVDFADFMEDPSR